MKENIKAPRHWPLYGESNGDRWIPRTKTSNGKCFQLMTSSGPLPSWSTKKYFSRFQSYNCISSFVRISSDRSRYTGKNKISWHIEICFQIKYIPHLHEWVFQLHWFEYILLVGALLGCEVIQLEFSLLFYLKFDCFHNSVDNQVMLIGALITGNNCISSCSKRI